MPVDSFSTSLVERGRKSWRAKLHSTRKFVAKQRTSKDDSVNVTASAKSSVNTLDELEEKNQTKGKIIGQKIEAEIETLQSKLGALQSKLDDTNAKNDWLKQEFENTSRQLIGMSISKKQDDLKRLEMKAKSDSEDTSNLVEIMQENITKASTQNSVKPSNDDPVVSLEEERSNKENPMPRASKLRTPHKAVLKRHHQKKKRALAAKEGFNV